MPKIIHFRNNCIGCNVCVEHSSQHWEISREDGKSNLKGAEQKKGIYILSISALEVEKSKQAANDCPVKIIQVVED
ncbi:ferredoxin [Candidatus Woesearchaeota archaeon]|nr:ferredoxin [Candidatus Woesearchaeota archaeon]